MNFHQSAAERFAETLFNYISENFDGKTVNSDECNVELMIKKLPKDFDDDIDYSNSPTNTDTDTVVIPSPPTNDGELFTDNIKSPEPNKKPDSDKKKRKPNKCLYFRTHPDNQSSISDKAKEPHPDKPGKDLGKVKAGCILWNELSDNEREEWSQRCMNDNSD
jgi:hypothetical protein